jgi:rare lipoprotein A
MKNILLGKISQILSIIASGVVLTAFSGCSSVQYEGNSQFVGYTEYGQASYYAMKYQFSKTASG